jgi:hypothetical protein
MIMAEHNGERMYFFMATFYRGLGIRCQISVPGGDGCTDAELILIDKLKLD